jgi:hypothetical protein
MRIGWPAICAADGFHGVGPTGLALAFHAGLLDAARAGGGRCAWAALRLDARLRQSPEMAGNPALLAPSRRTRRCAPR